MFGINYDVVEYYQYENKTQLEKELELNKVGRYEFMPDEKWIKYTINQERCIRLSDLIYYIEEKLIYMSIGQILKLCEKLLQKVIDLNENQIDHKYLISYRIWLILEKDSEFLTICNQNLKYSISFTGFQCPIYETGEEQQVSSNSILKIVDKIITVQKGSMQEMKGQKYWYNLIFQPILQKDQINSKIEIISNNTSIYRQDKYYDKYQKDIKLLLDQRKQMMQNTKNVFNQTTSNCENQQNAFVLSYQIYGSIPILVQNINSKNFKDFENFDYNKQLKDLEEYWKKKIDAVFKVETLKLINEEFVQINQFLKFEISEQEELIMVDEIKKEMTKTYVYITNYFFNTIWIWLNNIQLCQQQFEKLISQMSKELAKERVMLKIKQIISLVMYEMI
ncbi:unnamed protein product [Paramecium sonneborni]|uniref:Uncharacterized protein n=1 Tax=Paramecium sonneborni TaxID=65129 RepID=A0A8S1JTP7_9CILI|nr:unnamed protein product [Paramecium sonneborni]